ncbi:class I SAM-dependent methyltransferase [Desulfogranum mediterraneum]|uniref:class I SAM-dependent methyltransferase n=1 Tax=Desulfogranum mediterraneum TaxID=160661 RepID=UPI0004253F4F|nr:class I SAM-dependent methyltransferase [Desulfogranum mediterraneum]
MTEKKFDPKKLEKLNNPQRLVDIPPAYVLERLNLVQPEVLVEIGAGTGFFSIAFLQATQAAQLYACEISEPMLDWMREQLVPDHPEIIPVLTKDEAIPLADEIADLVFMICLHHELDHSALTLNEAKRLLRPGGRLFVVDWKKEEMAQGPPANIRCTAQEVAQQLQEAGLSEVHSYSELAKHFLVVATKAAG